LNSTACRPLVKEIVVNGSALPENFSPAAAESDAASLAWSNAGALVAALASTSTNSALPPPVFRYQNADESGSQTGAPGRFRARSCSRLA
jgi:hypothetical protein